MWSFVELLLSCRACGVVLVVCCCVCGLFLFMHSSGLECRRTVASPLRREPCLSQEQSSVRINTILDGVLLPHGGGDGPSGTQGAAGRRVKWPSGCGVDSSPQAPRYSRKLHLGSQSHSRISFLCVCARVLFVNKLSVIEDNRKRLKIKFYQFSFFELFRIQRRKVVPASYPLPLTRNPTNPNPNPNLNLNPNPNHNPNLNANANLNPNPNRNRLSLSLSLSLIISLSLSLTLTLTLTLALAQTPTPTPTLVLALALSLTLTPSPTVTVTVTATLTLTLTVTVTVTPNRNPKP